jgi:peptidyl-prolyl cis-trans isomerase C
VLFFKANTVALARLACGAALLVLCACGNGDEAEVPVQVDGAAAASVNGEKIYVSDVELEAVARGLIPAGQALDQKSQEYKTVLDQLVDQKLMAQEAVRRGIDQDSAAKRRLHMARERILGNLLVEDLVAREVTDARIDRMYAEQVSLQQSNDEVSIAHILFASEEEARAVYDEIRDGASFESMARAHSKDSATRMENGSLGYVSPNDQMDPFPAMIADTPEGGISKPFLSADGWHILKVKDRRTRAPKTRDEMRPEIVTFLTLNQISKILRELRTQAVIQEGGPGTASPPATPLSLGEDAAPPEGTASDSPEGNEL